jgi:thiol-disulfide isomerase/thioredoxin
LKEKLMNKQSNIATTLAAALCAAALGATFGVADEQATTPRLELVDVQRVAPNFIGIDNWLNSVPLNIADLRGKVVLVDFWTYGCYNCVNTLPHVTRLYDTYRDKGLVVVGIHTPEFPFEKSLGNLQAALKRHGIRYPVAQDNAYATWNAYRNQYWPAQYIVDQSGKIVFEHAGEGRYEEIERAIQKLLDINS